MSFPMLKEMLSRIEIMNEMIKHESTTMHINHTARSCKFEGYIFKLKFIVT